MAKKDFKKTLNETSNLEEVTRSYFSEETLNKARAKHEEVKQTTSEQRKNKRKYTKLKTSENKNKVIHFRVTEKQYKELIKKAEQTNSKSISDYLSKLIRG